MSPKMGTALADRQDSPAGSIRLGQRMSPAGGVEISGADLTQPLSSDLAATIRQALLDHHVVVVRDQALSQEQQYAFTLNFGELEDHVGRHSDTRYAIVHSVTNLDRDGNPTQAPDTRGNYFWHTDKSYHAVPSLMTMLHAVELPPDGGDTQFANMMLAYRALPQATKDRLAGLRAVHSWEASRLKSGSKAATEAEKLERPPVVHPIVRTHPETGGKALYIGNHAGSVEGLDDGEGKPLLAE